MSEECLHRSGFDHVDGVRVCIECGLLMDNDQDQISYEVDDFIGARFQSNQTSYTHQLHTLLESHCHSLELPLYFVDQTIALLEQAQSKNIIKASDSYVPKRTRLMAVACLAMLAMPGRPLTLSDFGSRCDWEPKDIAKAMAILRTAGIQNLDLIPGETVSSPEPLIPRYSQYLEHQLLDFDSRQVKSLAVFVCKTAERGGLQTGRNPEAIAMSSLLISIASHTSQPSLISSSKVKQVLKNSSVTASTVLSRILEILCILWEMRARLLPYDKLLGEDKQKGKGLWLYKKILPFLPEMQRYSQILGDGAFDECSQPPSFQFSLEQRAHNRSLIEQAKQLLRSDANKTCLSEELLDVQRLLISKYSEECIEGMSKQQIRSLASLNPTTLYLQE